AALCAMTKHIQECKSCGQKSEGELYHLGFSDMDCMYCDSCPRVLLLKDRDFLKKKGIVWPSLLPGDEGWEHYNRHLFPLYEKLESLFKPCECGGRFRAWAVARCSQCNDYLFGVAPEPDKPSMWHSKYVFVTVGSYNDIEQLNGKFA
uniref:hypothetical protein n=1 Tax=Marinimicrobium alkaliphilum TaxID=2202654 RepID=UPI001E5733D3